MFDEFKREPRTKNGEPILNLGERSKGFFTLSRFGPGAISLIGIFVLATVVLFEYRLMIAATTTAIAAIALFGIKSAEMLHIEKAEQRQLIGAECLVTKRISKTERGIVRVYDASLGKFTPELWSAESDSVIEEGTVARVLDVRSIILRVGKPRN